MLRLKACPHIARNTQQPGTTYLGPMDPNLALTYLSLFPIQTTQAALFITRARTSYLQILPQEHQPPNTSFTENQTDVPKTIGRLPPASVNGTPEPELTFGSLH